MQARQPTFQVTQPARVLVAGCGDLGQGLAVSCAGSAGLHVTGLRRSAVAADYPCLQANLLVPDSLRAIPDQFDYVVYTATPSERSPAGYRAIYLHGLQNLLARLAGGRLKRVFFVSSTGVYGQDQGEWVDEASPTEPSSFSGQILLEAEQWLQAQVVPSTLVRFAGIYGPGRERLLRKVVSGCQAVPEPPYYTNRIHRDDCVGILHHLLRRAVAKAELPEILVGVDQAPVSEWEVLSWLAQQVGCPPPQAVASDGHHNKRCRSVWLARLGYELRYPDFRAGYADMVADFCARR